MSLSYGKDYTGLKFGRSSRQRKQKALGNVNVTAEMKLLFIQTTCQAEELNLAVVD